jgi:hypothetical protein
VETVTALLHREVEPAEELEAEEPEPDHETLEAEALLDDLADEAAFSDGPAVELDVADLPPEEPAPLVESAVGAGEESLRKAVAAVSEEIIREIAWEVVPELAEALIRERIRELEREESET